MGFVLDEENLAYNKYSRLIKFNNERDSTLITINDNTIYNEIYVTDDFDVAYSNNILLEFIYDIPVYLSSSVTYSGYERDIGIKVEYALNESINWISLGESEKTDGCIYGTNFSMRLSNHIFLQNIIATKIKFRILMKRYNNEILTINPSNQGDVTKFSSNYFLLQYEKNDYLYNKAYSSITRKKAELFSTDNGFRNFINTSTISVPKNTNADIVFNSFNKSNLTSLFIILDIPITCTEVSNVTTQSSVTFIFYFSINNGVSWLPAYASRVERKYQSTSAANGTAKLGQGSYNKTERFYLYVDDPNVVNATNIMFKVNVAPTALDIIISDASLDNKVKAQIKVYNIFSNALTCSKSFILTQYKENYINKKDVSHKTDAIFTANIVNVDFVPVFETTDFNCDVGSDVLLDLCYSIKNGNSGNGSFDHTDLGITYNWPDPATVNTMNPIPPTAKVGFIHYNTGWFWNGPFPQYADYAHDLTGDGANPSWQSENNVRVHENSYPPSINQNVFDKNTIIWTNYQWYLYGMVFLQQWWACEPVGYPTATSQENNVKHSENGVIIKIEYSTDEGVSWNTYVENNLKEGRCTLYPKRVTALGDIRVGGINSKGRQSTYEASNNNNSLLIKRSLLLENILNNKIRFRVSAKSIPKQIFRAPYANVNNVPYASLIYNLPYSFAKWSLPNNESIPGDDLINNFTIHASFSEIKTM